jgi:hypothetical protein
MSISENLMLLTLTGLSYVQHNWFWLGLYNGAFLLAFNAEDKSKTKEILTALAIGSVVPIASYFAIPYIASRLDTPDTSSGLSAILWVGCAVLSQMAAAWWMLYGVRIFRTLTNKVNRYLHPNDLPNDRSLGE